MKNLWEATCAEGLATKPFSGRQTADLVIIGGGFTGCSAALEAANLGARVTLLEGKTIGYGGSGRNVGLVNAGLWLPPDTVEDQLGETAGKQLNSALAKAPETVFNLIKTHDISCEALRNGTLHCAHAPKGLKDLQARYAQQIARGAPVELLDKAAAQQAVGSTAVHGALLDKRAGTINPLGYVTGLARAAAALGAKIHERSEVVQITRKNGDWLVETQAGKIAAKSILIAGNAYARRTAQEMTPKTPLVHYFQMATDPLPDALGATMMPGGQGCWDTALIMSSFRRDAAGRLVFGAMGNPDQLGIHRRWATRALTRMFPQLQGIPLPHFWSGRIAMTGDHLPKMVRLGDNALSIFGYSGRGIGPGTVFGTSAARHLLGATGDLPVDPVETHKDFAPALQGIYYEFGARMIHAISR